MGEYYGMLTDIEKRIILSLVAIEKVTTLKLHKNVWGVGEYRDGFRAICSRIWEIFLVTVVKRFIKKLKYNLDFNFWGVF